MKKSFILMSLMLGALALTSCNNLDSTIEAPKGNFSFKVSTDTRAGIDNNNVVWQSGDKIAFGAVLSGSTDTLTVAREFSYIGSNTFSGDTTLDAQKTYDFYAFFPANGGSFFLDSKKVNPSAYSKWVNVGAQTISQSGQSMDGIMANAPMIGVAKGQSPENLTINLHHLAALLDFTIVNNSGSETAIKSLQVTFPSGKKFCGTYYPSYDGTLKASGNDYVYNSCTVNVSGSNTVANGASFHVYVPIAPTTLAANSKISFKITTAAGISEIEKTVSKDVTFTAGTISTQSLELNAIVPEKPHYTWDLSKASYSDTSSKAVTWTSDYATVTNNQGTSKSPATNYVPGTSKNYLSTRFYNGNILTITPAAGYIINKIEFTAMSDSYANDFATSTWTNAAATLNGTTVTVTPQNESSAVSAAILKTVGFSSITIYYETRTSIVKNLTGIEVSGQTTSFYVGDKFEFDGTCTATYDGGTTKTVIPTSVSTPDMTSTGTKTVTVSYTENGTTKSAQYTITVAANVSTGGKYVRVTSASQLTDGQYLIVCDTTSVAFNGALTTFDAVGNTVDVTISGESIEATASLKSAEFTYSSADGSFKGTSGMYFGQTKNDNGLATSTTAYANTVTVKSNGDVTIACAAGAVLRFNAASNQLRFRYFKSSTYTNQKSICLYKYTK
ncbi:MAG: hypothetical protein MJY60_07980 [Bacteroidales bacterium]|nr:hypothetical protein [Bacteroidales bacterium]